MSGFACNCQDEHNCVKAALAPLVQIAQQGCIRVTVPGHQVVAKVWINFIWVISKETTYSWDILNSSKEGIKCHYRDCKFGTEDLDNLKKSSIGGNQYLDYL